MGTYYAQMSAQKTWLLDNDVKLKILSSSLEVIRTAQGMNTRSQINGKQGGPRQSRKKTYTHERWEEFTAKGEEGGHRKVRPRRSNRGQFGGA